MKKSKIVIVIFILVFSCQKNPFWVGNKEFFTVSYSNTLQDGPQVSESSIDESPFISHGTISTNNLGNGTMQIIVDGIRIENNKNNFEISKITIYEKDDKKFKIQDEFSNLASSNKTDIASVLVLDMSTSLKDLVTDLKSYAKKFVDKIVTSTDNSKVAVVFFCGKDNILTSAFYDHTNAEQLKTEIDNFTDYESRTALFEATQTGITMLDNLVFSGTKTLVVFTDGGDNDSNNPSALKEQISSSDYLRISIGLKGDDFDKADLEAIASAKSNSIVVKKEEKLEGVFDTVAKQIVSIYKVIYERSDQILENEIEIKFEFEVDKIK